jgi:hypothetical protein
MAFAGMAMQAITTATSGMHQCFIACPIPRTRSFVGKQYRVAKRKSNSRGYVLTSYMPDFRQFLYIGHTFAAFPLRRATDSPFLPILAHWYQQS